MMGGGISIGVDSGAQGRPMVRFITTSRSAGRRPCSASRQVYVEGKIKLRSWDAPDGPRSGLSVVASVIQPLGLIGAKRPKKPRSPKGEAPAKTKTNADVNAPLPFDDPIPF